MEPLSDEERRCARQKFWRSLRYLRHIEMFYVPSIRGVISRSIGAKHVFRLPLGSIPIGVYQFPFPADDFLGDLDDVLAQLEAAQKRRAATA